MKRIDELADVFVSEWARLSPLGATYVGIAGFDDCTDDLSPDGYEARAELTRRTIHALDIVEPDDGAGRVSKDAMLERLGVQLATHDAGFAMSEISVVSGALHELRGVLEVMPTEGEPAVAAIAARLQAFPTALRQLERTLRNEAAAGRASARAQMLAVAEQCDAWTDPARDNFFCGLAGRLDASRSLATDLARGAAAATAATADFARFLRRDLAPLGRENQAAGPERYALASRSFLGAEVDLVETYLWAFDELDQVARQMRSAAAVIAGPGASVDEAVAVLDADPARRIPGKDAFRNWMQSLADKTVTELDGTHFDIEPPVRRIECRLTSTSDGGIYYTGPSEDFSRPGRMWWSVPEGMTAFSTWRETTTVYHEGVPGHHLQVGQALLRADRLNRWRRLLSWCSGHGEGWALYAERLMDELGYLADPGDRMGMLDAQAWRTCRVIVDIGMHLELGIPRYNPFGFHPGERWTPELGWEFLRAHTRLADEMLRFEWKRYLGWPGQAPSYKVGERIWLQAREESRQRKGSAFDLKTFHRDALNLGSLGLDPLRRALARL